MTEENRSRPGGGTEAAKSFRRDEADSTGLHRQLARRRDAALRCPPLRCGRRDPLGPVVDAPARRR